MTEFHAPCFICGSNGPENHRCTGTRLGLGAVFSRGASEECGVAGERGRDMKQIDQAGRDSLWLALILRDPRARSRNLVVRRVFVSDLLAGRFPQRILRQLPQRLRRFLPSKEGHGEPLR